MRSLTSSVAALVTVRVFGMAAAFMVTVLFARSLGPDALGFYGYVVICLGIIGIPINQGWGMVLLRDVARGKHSGEWGHASGLMRAGLLASAGISALLLTSAFATERLRPDWWPDFLTWQLVLVLGIVFLLDQFTGLRLAVLRGLGRAVWGQAPEMLVRPALIIFFFLIFGYLLFPPPSLQDALWALLVAYLVCALLGAAILRAMAPRELTAARRVYRTRHWFTAATVIAANAGLNALTAQLDILLLGVFGTLEQVGIYRVAAQIALVSGAGYAALNFLAMDRFARAFGAGKIEEVRRTSVLLARLSLLGSLPVPCLFLFFGETILQSIFGSAFGAALQPLFLLLAVQVLTAWFGMGSGLMLMSGNERVLLWITGLSAALNAALCVALIPPFGATGAALSALSSLFALRLALWLAAYRKLGIDASVIGLPPPGR